MGTSEVEEHRCLRETLSTTLERQFFPFIEKFEEKKIAPGLSTEPRAPICNITIVPNFYHQNITTVLCSMSIREKLKLCGWRNILSLMLR